MWAVVHACPHLILKGHNYIGQNYIGHGYVDHSYVGHNYISHHYIGHKYICHNYICHNYIPCGASSTLNGDDTWTVRANLVAPTTRETEARVSAANTVCARQRSLAKKSKPTTHQARHRQGTPSSYCRAAKLRGWHRIRYSQRLHGPASTYIVTAYVVMAYVAMAYLVMAYALCHMKLWPR